MMIRNDDVQPVVTRPMKRLVRANSAIDADDEFVTFARGFFERCLLNTVAFGETMRDVITGGRA